MTRKSMGQFMAALRKANGMTQREVADRLNVSDKAVSRWERDECAPDLSLIPAIAEMYGVTCDELLRGERILNEPQTQSNEMKNDKKVDKQLRALVNRSLSSFKTLIWISLALSLVGLICMFGISYGFYRPVIGFAVMLLFEVVAFVLAAIAVNKLKEKKADNELFENADEMLIKKFNDTLGIFSFVAFFTVFAVVLISFPLIRANNTYILYAVPTISYFLSCSVLTVLLLIVLFIKVKEPYIAWITGQPLSAVQSSGRKEGYIRELDFSGKKTLRKMNFMQWGTVIFASILFVISPWFEVENPFEISYVMLGMNIAGLVLLALDIVFFVIFLISSKKIRRHLMLPGIRNVLLIGSALLYSMWHSVGFNCVDGWHGSTINPPVYERYDVWRSEYLFMAVGLSVLLVLVFALLDIARKRYRAGKADCQA